MKKQIYGLYDISNYEQCVLIANTVNEIAHYLNKTENCIFKAIQKNTTVCKKFKVVRLGDERDFED